MQQEIVTGLNFKLPNENDYFIIFYKRDLNIYMYCSCIYFIIFKRCECPIGYTGKDCTKKIDYCSSSPCKNGGQCKSISFNYTCICPLSFIGNNCEIGKFIKYVKLI